jgi:hypothetical protein
LEGLKTLKEEEREVDLKDAREVLGLCSPKPRRSFAQWGMN